MRLISREEALRICEYQAVEVEFTNRGLRFRQPFTPGSQFYMSTGPYDFQNARYYLVNGWGHGGLGSVTVPKVRKSSTKEIGETDEEWTDAQPIEVEGQSPKITIEIMDEGGKKPAPKEILPGTTLKLKAVPSQGSGTFSWKSKSKAIRIENAGSQVVSLSVVAGQREAPSGEVIELVYTPSGRSALSPVTHAVSVIKVLIMKNDAHAYGYDEYTEIASKDHNWKHFQFKPDSKSDIVSIEKEEVGLLDVHYTGTDGKSLRFKSGDPLVCECKVKDHAKNPILLEVQAKSADYKETKIEVRYGEDDGPIVAEINIVVMAPLIYKAKYFRVEDPESPGTALKVAATKAKFEEALERIYRPGIAKWRIDQEPATVKSKYDIIKNGSLDIEPGIVSEELTRLKADCKYNGTRIIHVHNLRWSYYLAADAGPKDTKIKLKSYGHYLDFVGTNSYLLEDTSGKSVRVKIKSIDLAKAEFELSAPLGVELKTENKAALIWPLGGLSGDPTLVSDFGGLPTLVGIVAHELGHSNAGLKDIAEIQNIMHGVAEGNDGLRGRALPLFYHPDHKEKQWAVMPGRT